MDNLRNFIRRKRNRAGPASTGIVPLNLSNSWVRLREEKSEDCEAYSQERQEERTYRVDRFAEVSATQAPEYNAPRPLPLPYDHPSHQEVRIRLTARGVLVLERDPQLGDTIQPEGAEGGLLCFRCPPTEYDWLVRTLLSLGPDAEVLAPDELRELVRQAAQDIANRYTQ